MADVYCGFHKWYFPTEPAPVVRTVERQYEASVPDYGGICPRCRAEYEAERVRVHALTPAEILRGVARDEVKQ